MYFQGYHIRPTDTQIPSNLDTQEYNIRPMSMGDVTVGPKHTRIEHQTRTLKIQHQTRTLRDPMRSRHSSIPSDLDTQGYRQSKIYKDAILPRLGDSIRPRHSRIPQNPDFRGVRSDPDTLPYRGHHWTQTHHVELAEIKTAGENAINRMR